jgi:uncharacterized membrane protein YdfJ with MMPL/SSD domain
MSLSTSSLAHACARNPRRVVALWLGLVVLALVAVAFLLHLTTGGEPTNNPASQRAKGLIANSFPEHVRRETTDVVLVHSSRYGVRAPPFRAFVAGLAKKLRATGKVASTRSYLSSDDASLVSRDRHATLIAAAVLSDDDIDPVLPLVRSADDTPAFDVSITGLRTLNHDFTRLSQDDLSHGELRFGLPAALFVLLLVFGAVVAGLLPLVMALVAIVVALGVAALLAQMFGLSIFTVNMLTGMGLALGIDYSLFIVSRYREERANGRIELDAITGAGGTASRAVLFSGTAFVVAMFGLLLVPNSIMQSIAAGAILAGIASVATALTLLPALLGLLGDRVNALRIPLVGSRTIERSNPEGRFWRWVVERVQRHAALSLLVAVALLLAAASPVLGLDVGSRGVASLPDRFVSKQGFQELQRLFPGATANPVRIVVDEASTPPVRNAVQRLQRRLVLDPDFGRGRVERSANGQVAVLTVPVRGDSAGARASASVRRLRAEVIPDTFSGTEARVYVGGDTAETVDYVDSVSAPAPYVFVFVLALTLIVLTMVFRSLVIAATAVLLNLLSVGAAYGILVLVFQHGVGAGLLGFTQADTIEAWVPLFLFGVLFGLSMDYQVFLLTRIRERHLRSGRTEDAVAYGVASTARLITGAALIIIAVFLGFAMGDLIMFQQMGFGVAVALLIDATVIRSILVPAVMTLLGKWNWYLPRWLRWLPELQVETASARKPVSSA